MRDEFRLTKITLHNMFNYRGTHVIDFNSSSERNVYLFNIMNGGGKTSLFLSMKWGFYGFDSEVTYSKDGKSLGSIDFMNQDVYEEGTFHVSIEFNYDGKKMRIYRVCPDYRSNKTDLVLTVNGQSFHNSDAEWRVSKIIPPEYGDFFMFDGETLQKIASNTGDARKTENVMKMLGLSRLRILKNHLEGIRKNLEVELSNKKSSNKECDSLNRNIINLRKEEAKVNSNLRSFNEEISDLSKEISTLEASRSEFSDKEGRIRDLEKTETRIRLKENEIEGIRRSISEYSSDAFVLFMESDVRSLVEKYEDELKKLKREESGDKRLRDEFTHIQKRVIDEHMQTCPVCNSIVDDAIKLYLNDVLSQSKYKGELYKEHQDKIRHYEYLTKILKDELSKPPRDLRKKCDDLFKAEEDLEKLNGELESLNRIVMDSDRDEVNNISKTLESKYRRRAFLVGEQGSAERKHSNIINDIAKYQKKLNGLSGLTKEQSELTSEISHVSRIISGLDSVIRRITESKRLDILDMANMVFLKITNKGGVYRGLEYDRPESFSMHIVRRDGSAVMLPSSGENHVIAISFLISLGLNTERLTPMMMDTPLSRLDDVHKPNIGSMLASLDNQVIFLAQPGELDAKTEEALEPAVAKRFIAAPTDDNSAFITEVE